MKRHVVKKVPGSGAARTEFDPRRAVTYGLTLGPWYEHAGGGMRKLVWALVFVATVESMVLPGAVVASDC
jgi:hypothetical protein